MGIDIQSNLNTKQSTADMAKQISLMLEGLRFGSIEITVHDSRVVQIERREKIRPDLAKAKFT